MKNVAPEDFIDSVATLNREAWKRGKRRHRVFLDRKSWNALEISCWASLGPNIGWIVPEEGMVFMGIKMFKKKSRL